MLSTLNDDCIYKILEWVPLDDLCSLSRTCKRLQALCDNHFRRRLPNEAHKEVQVQVAINGKLRCKKYVTYFDNFITNLSILGGALRFDENVLVNFIRTKCDQNLHQITIFGKLRLVPFCVEIQDFLRNVEIVQFKTRVDEGEDESTFLKYCPKLTTLNLLQFQYKKNVCAILQQKYEKLRHFHFLSAHTVKAETLQTFFQKNNNIQCISWEFSSSTYNETAIMMECVVNFALNLEHFHLDIDWKLMEHYELLCGYLARLCDQKNFKSLELGGLRAQPLHLRRLSNLKQLKKINFSGNIGTLSSFVTALIPLTQLKIIVFRYLRGEDNRMQWSTIDELSSIVDGTQNIALPQIEEILIEESEEKQLFTYLMQFARHWVNLKKITVRKSRYRPCNETFHVAELNWARMKLANARELTIFTDIAGNATNWDNDLVKLKFVEPEPVLNETLFKEHCMVSLE